MDAFQDVRDAVAERLRDALAGAGGGMTCLDNDDARALLADRDALAGEVERLRAALKACVAELTELYGEVLPDTKQQGRERVKNDPVLACARAALETAR